MSEYTPSGVDPEDVKPEVVELTVELGRNLPWLYEPGAPLNRWARVVLGSDWLLAERARIWGEASKSIQGELRKTWPRYSFPATVARRVPNPYRKSGDDE